MLRSWYSPKHPLLKTLIFQQIILYIAFCFLGQLYFICNPKMSGSPEIIIISSGGVMILILLSLFGNVLVCCAVYHSRKLRTRVNYLIMSLAAADIMVATIAMPIWIYSEITDFQQLSGRATHNLIMFWNFIDILGATASIANLTVISYERLWSVCSPLKHRRYSTNITLASMILFVWLYALILATSTIPFILEKWTVIYTAVLGFFLPLLLIIVAYFLIVIIVNRSPRNVITPQDNSRINVTICIIIGLFFICWAPHFILSVLSRYCKSCYNFITHNLWIRSLSVWLHYANSCVNPIVYGIANAQYKEAFKSVLKKICFKCFYDDKTNPDKMTTNQTVTSNFLGSPLLFGTQPERIKHKENELCVELSIDNKEQHNTSRYARNELAHDEYLPGDYRALPVSWNKRKVEQRWDSRETESSYLCSSSSYEDSLTLQRTLLNPESLARTSYLWLPSKCFLL